MARIALAAALCLALIAVASWSQLRAPPVAVPPRGLVRLIDVTVVSPPAAGRVHQTVVVRDGQVEEVRPTSAADGTSVELRANRGAFVLPGLIDMHFHAPAPYLGQAELFSMLALRHGVTSIRDPGTPTASGFELRERIRAGAFPGPRVFTCGVFLDGDPPVWSGSLVVRDAGEGRAAVRKLVARGVDCIKVYDRIGAAALAGVLEAAHELGVPVMGHVPFAVPFADAHISDVQHLTGVASLVDPSWSSYGEMADAWRALDEEKMDAVVRSSLDQGVAHTPTLVVFDKLSRLVSYDRLVSDPSALLLPRFWREVGWNPGFDPGLRRLPAGERQRLLEHDYADILLREKELVRRLHAAGVAIHAGTDVPNAFVVPGVSLHEEMRLLVDCGLEPMEAWAAATRWPGQWLHEPRLGAVEPGAPADLLVFRADPTRDLAQLSTLEAVVADGRFYSVEELERGFERHRAHFESRSYETLSLPLARLGVRLLRKGDDTPGD